MTERRHRRRERTQTYKIIDPKGFLADYFGFDDWSPEHALTITLTGNRGERRKFIADLRRIADEGVVR